MRNRIVSFLTLLLALYVLSQLLTRCENVRGMQYLSLQNREQTGILLHTSGKDSSRMAVLQQKNDSLLMLTNGLSFSNKSLLTYAKSSDSLLRLQTDSTRRVRIENRFLSREQEIQNKSIQQMFWVLANGQQDIRTIVDSVRKESRILAQREHDLSVKLSDSTQMARTIIAQNNLVPEVTPDSTGLADKKHPKATTKKRTKSSSINNKKRLRQAERRTKRLRRKTLMRGGV